MNKINFPRLLLLLLFSLALTVSLSAEYFVIDHYNIEVEVSENNSYRIVETIDVDFSQERHGIYRTIPLKFDGRRVILSKLKVRGHDSKIERSADEATMRIGSADSYVNGKISYRISYDYDVGADDLPDMDEFNHNLIGLEWDTEIKSADFRIEMPKGFDSSVLNFTSGDYGSKDNSGVEWSVEGNVITGRLLKPLNPRQGLTAALPLPEGYWVGAKEHKTPGWLLFQVFSFPFYALVILASFLLWFFKGRDNKLFPSVEFDPPEGMNPSEVGYIIDGTVDNKDVTSLIIYWAEQGLIELEEESKERILGKDKKTLHLIKKQELGADAKDYEKRLFKKLFNHYGDGERVSTEDLEDKFYTEVRKAQKSIKESFTKNPERAIYQSGSAKFTLIASLLAALPIMFVLVEGFTNFSGRLSTGLFGILFSLFLLIPAFLLGSGLTDRSKRGRKKIFSAVIFGGFSFLFFGIFLTLGDGEISLMKYAAAVVSGITASVFVSIMVRRTEYGDKMLEKTLGFKEFIKEAEKDKLETLFASNPSYFYSILPYAMVLDLSDIWGKHFEGIAVEPPSWYRGYGRNHFSTAVFASTLNNSFNTMNTSMTSAPSSSGSSGSSSSGGFSGGGSGGGGGGSW